MCRQRIEAFHALGKIPLASLLHPFGNAVPYPLPFYSRGLDGRIDDPKAGWKGRGLWMTYSSYMPKFTETHIGSVDHMQIRPNPLAN